MRIFLEVNQIKELLELSKEHERDHALFHLAFSTGLRISDLLRLQRKALFDSDGLIVRALRVRMKKTKRPITRPLRDDCRAAVARYLETRLEDDNPYLFAQESNSKGAKRPMTRQSAHRIYKHYLGQMFPKSMLSGAACHTIRRSAAKLISLKTGRAECAMRFLGHTNLASTMSYVDVDDFEKKANATIEDLDL